MYLAGVKVGFITGTPNCEGFFSLNPAMEKSYFTRLSGAYRLDKRVTGNSTKLTEDSERPLGVDY